MQRDIDEIAAGRQVFTPDEWESIRKRLDAAGYGPARRVRLALNHPEAGWQPVEEQETPVQRAPASVDIFERLP